MKVIFLFVFSCFFLSACSKSGTNDFDVVCEIFAGINSQSSDLSEEAMLRISVRKVREQLAVESSARVSWEAITGAPASERYNLFKYGAEETLNRNWDCPMMKVVIESSYSSS